MKTINPELTDASHPRFKEFIAAGLIFGEKEKLVGFHEVIKYFLFYDREKDKWYCAKPKKEIFRFFDLFPHEEEDEKVETGLKLDKKIYKKIKKEAKGWGLDFDNYVSLRLTGFDGGFQ